MENGGGSEGSQKPSERFYTLPIPFSLYTYAKLYGSTNP